jgi:hypothetical protein
MVEFTLPRIILLYAPLSLVILLEPSKLVVAQNVEKYLSN